jgi:hypothetical protein
MTNEPDFCDKKLKKKYSNSKLQRKYEEGRTCRVQIITLAEIHNQF